MSEEEFCALMEADNEWVRQYHARLDESDQKIPEFDSIEELRAHFNCHPLDDILKDTQDLFEVNG